MGIKLRLDLENTAELFVLVAIFWVLYTAVSAGLPLFRFSHLLVVKHRLALFGC